MVAAMKTPLTRMQQPYICKASLALAFSLLGAMPALHAQNIYKCSRGGQVEYTDHPCPGRSGVLIHKADDSEIIDQYLDLGQFDIARRYAQSRHLDALYRQRMDIYNQRMLARAKKQADEAAAAKQHAEEARQQALVAAAANQGRLQGENDALHQQINQYRDQQPTATYNNGGAYWGGAPAYWNTPGNGDYGHGDGHGDGHGHGPGHDQRPPTPPAQPIFHPCTQLAGGRVQC